MPKCTGRTSARCTTHSAREIRLIWWSTLSAGSTPSSTHNLSTSLTTPYHTPLAHHPLLLRYRQLRADTAGGGEVTLSNPYSDADFSSHEWGDDRWWKVGWHNHGPSGAELKGFFPYLKVSGSTTHSPPTTLHAWRVPVPQGDAAAQGSRLPLRLHRRARAICHTHCGRSAAGKLDGSRL